MENLNCSKNILGYLKNYQELQVFFLDPLVAFLKAVQAKCSKYDDNQLMLAVKENLLRLLILGKINVTNGKYMLARNSKRFPQGRRNNPAAPRFQVPSSAIEEHVNVHNLQHQTFSPPQQCGRLTSAEPSPAAPHDVLFYHEGQLPNSSASDILLQRSKNLSASQPREVLNVSPEQVATSAKNLSPFKQLRLVPKEGMTEIPPACMELLNCGNVPEHAHEVKDEHHDETKTANQTAKALEPVEGNAHGAFLLQHRVKQCRNKVGNLYKIGEKDLMANAKDMPWFFVPELEGILSLEGNTKQDFSRRNAICISREEALENFQKIVTAETAHETFNHPQSRDSSPNKRMKYEETGKIKAHVHPEFARKKIMNKYVILQQNHLKKQADEAGKQLATIRPVKVNNEDNSAICSISEYKLKNHPGECLENQHKYGEVSDSKKETTYKMHIPFQNGQLQEQHKIDPPDFQVCLSSTDECGFQFPPSNNNLNIITKARHDDYLKGLQMQRDRSPVQKSQIDAMPETFYPYPTEFQHHQMDLMPPCSFSHLCGSS